MTNVRRTLLVIDNDPSVPQTIVAHLERQGYAVRLEADSNAGLAWFEANKPCLTIVDLNMPGLDGLELLKRIRQIDAYAAVVVASASGSARDVVEALRQGATDYFVKPVTNPHFLVHAIGRALDTQDLKRENERYRQDLERVNAELKDYVRLLECDQKAARQVQRNLLPPTPAVWHGVTIEHVIVPSLYLSGDFIDYGMLKHRYVASYLTDVSGHGASSAFVTIWLKQLVRRVFREHYDKGTETRLLQDPNQLVTLINRELLQSQFGCHLTCFVGVIDLQDNCLYYILAGHLPLPIVIEQGQARYLQGKGKPVGIFPEAQWQVFCEPLQPGFSVVVFSDGILEILPKKNLLDREAYLLQQLQGSNGSLSDIKNRLLLSENDSSPDDIAILCMTQRGGI